MYLKFYVIFQMYRTTLRSDYDPTKMSLSILYWDVLHMLHANISQIGSVVLKEISFECFFIIYGHDCFTSLIA